MPNSAIPGTTTISVFTRDTSDWPKKAKRYRRRCNCRKSLYIYENGKVRFQTAKTRSWEQAERLAQAELILRDPASVEMREIEKRDAEKRASEKAKNITIKSACDRWVASRKLPPCATAEVYATAAKRIQLWAADEDLMQLRDVTTDLLDE